MAKRSSKPLGRGELLDDDVADTMDVPAAVVCAVCGRCDCSGCAEEPQGTSGVIAIVPWERPQVPFFARLYGTVQATTIGADSFFRCLPDGSVSPALGFALWAEGSAVASTALMVVPLSLAAIPGLLLRFFASGPTRHSVLLATLVGIVGFTALLVGAHALHGCVLGRGARRRGIRMGLYACGWDFGSSPAGFAAASASEGVRSALALLASSITAPRRATDAALDGLFHLSGAALARARRRAMWIAMSASVPAVVLVLLSIVLTALLF